MNKYIVKYYVDNAEMIKGEIPHSEIWESEKIEAESSIEAIELCIDYLIEQIIQNSEFSPERSGDRINIENSDGETVWQYYNFCAELEAGDNE